jgi:formyltetrahydrofolate deformylase
MKQLATITVIGRDRTGVVARVTSFLFEQGANIEALEEQVTRGQFSMNLQASWRGERLARGDMEAGMARLGRDLGMEVRVRWTEPGRRQRMALMVTREGHCLEAILAAVGARRLKADAVVVIGNRPDLESRVRGHGLSFELVSWNDRAAAERRALDVLEEHGADFVVLARFMKILSPGFVWRFKNKIINIHPSLLPSFPGPQAYRQAYEQGVKVVGVTAHFVTMRLDEGPIIAQDCLRVRPEMGLKEIVAAGQRLEAKVLTKAVRMYLTGKLDVYWGVVRPV